MARAHIDLTDTFDRDYFAPRLGARRMAMLDIGKGAQRRLGAKEPGLRWRPTTLRMRRRAYPMSHIALHTAPTRRAVGRHQMYP